MDFVNEFINYWLVYTIRKKNTRNRRWKGVIILKFLSHLDQRDSISVSGRRTAKIYVPSSPRFESTDIRDTLKFRFLWIRLIDYNFPKIEYDRKEKNFGDILISGVHLSSRRQTRVIRFSDCLTNWLNLFLSLFLFYVTFYTYTKRYSAYPSDKPTWLN